MEKKMKGETAKVSLAKDQLCLEAEMISNPSLREMWYDLYGKTLSDEWYNTKAIKTIRRGGGH